MRNSILDVIVIGAGHAGLSISYFLKQNGLTHLVLEREKIGNSWRSQRWDSFKLNSSNKLNSLPGMKNIFPDQEGFCYASEFVTFLEQYSNTFELPVTEQCNVTTVESIDNSNCFSISTIHKGLLEKYLTKQIVLASGSQNERNIPTFARNISPDILQLHACEYKNATTLPEGAVLVVGTAQSGTQIAEDLIDAGREIFLSTSQVARIPRRYRGKDIIDWLIITGFYDLRKEEVTDPEVLKMKPPQVSGVGLRGRTSSLQALAKKGAVILGKMDNSDRLNVYFQPNAAANVKFGDNFSKKVKDMIDKYIFESGLVSPPPESDDADLPDVDAVCASHDISLNLKEKNISSIIWTTGFKGDFNYLKLPVFNADGTINHNNGITNVNGLYLLGLPWLRKRKSGIIYGIAEDAEFLIEKILNYR